MEWTKRHMNGQTNGGLQPQILTFYKNDLLVMPCVKFHQNMTSTSINTILTQNLNLNEMDEQTDERQTNRGPQPQIDIMF